MEIDRLLEVVGLEELSTLSLEARCDVSQLWNQEYPLILPGDRRDSY